MKRLNFVLLACCAMGSLPALGLPNFSAPAQEIVTAAEVNGTWHSKTAEFKVWALGHQKLRVEFSGTYEYGLMANSGTGGGIATIEGDTATFRPDKADEECSITMRFKGGKLVVEQEGGSFSCGFGKLVSAEGTYRKTSSRKPKFLSPVPTEAFLACPDEDKVIFSCTTTNKKQIELCDDGKTIKYSFGKASAKPELALSIPREMATTYQWQGIGRWANYSVEIQKGTTTYSVFYGYDRLTEEHEIEAGVDVIVNGNSVSKILCRNDTIDQNLEGIDLKPTT